MKWARKKTAPSSSPASLIASVLPISWFFKLRQKKGNFSEGKVKRGGLYFPTPSKSLPGGWKEGRFYSMGEDDAYWRISFSKEKRIQGRRSTGGMSMNNPLWYDSDVDFEVPVSGFPGLGVGEMDVARSGGYRNFDNMVSDIKRMKHRQHKDRNRGTPRSDIEFKVQRRRDQNLMKLSSRVSREKRQPELERDVFPIESGRTVQLENDLWKFAVSKSRKKPSKEANFRLSSVKEDYVFEEPRNLEDNRKLKEIKLKPTSTDSYCIKTKQHNNRVKVYSPRTECKIRALEDMKKSRIKWKKKGQEIRGGTIFDSFAVVKSSSNPRQDFRDSMVEMIREKGISQAEDLKELLACYLTLNCDAYHDLIINVFRQVWSELSISSIDTRIRNSQYFAY